METPNIKCPRTGRTLTPLSMDYWRLKKKLNRLLSESSSSDEDDRPQGLRTLPRQNHVAQKAPARAPARTPARTPARARSRIVPVLESSDENEPINGIGTPEDEATLDRTSKCDQRPKPTANVRTDESSSSSSDDDEEFVIRRKPRAPRRAQRFIIESSSEDSEPQNRSHSRLSSNETDLLSEALASTKITVPSSRSPTPPIRSHEVIEVSSDSDSRLTGQFGLDHRIKQHRRPKTPPVGETSAINNLAKLPLTEPKRRVEREFDRVLMPPPTEPRKKPTTKSQSKNDVDEESEFDTLLENLSNQKHDEDDYDESQVDLNNTVCEGETVNLQDRKFLMSLDDDVPLKSCHIDALSYRKRSFHAIKEELAAHLFTLYERAVFQKRFDQTIPISWNVRMLKTAGFCYYKKDSRGLRSARIELSPKVVDRVSRLRDTLLHELCHAAAWLIHGYRDGHGTLFKFWSHRAHQLLGLVVTTTHTYVIETKFIYRCKGCANEVRRHSKSLDTTRFRCSICKNQFELFVNSKHRKQMTPASDRKLTPFSKFVRDEYKSTKAASPHLSHGEVMVTLGERWKKLKNND